MAQSSAQKPLDAPPVHIPIQVTPPAMPTRTNRPKPLPPPRFRSKPLVPVQVPTPGPKISPIDFTLPSPTSSSKTEQMDLDPVEFRELTSLEHTIPQHFLDSAKRTLGLEASRFSTLFVAARDAISATQTSDNAGSQMMQTELARIARESMEKMESLRMENGMLKSQYDSMKIRLETMENGDAARRDYSAGQKRLRVPQS